MKFDRIMFSFGKQNKLNITGYALIVIWGMSTWLHINAIFAQLPLIIPCAPEHGSLPASLSLAIQLGNIGPIVLTIIQKKKLFGWITTDPGLKPPKIISAIIYIIIIIGSGGSFILAPTWGTNNGSISYALILTTFLFALAATSSSMAFFDYIKRYTAVFSVNALLFGESLNTILPPLLVLAQTRAYIPPCSNETMNQCGQVGVVFKTETYFVIIGCIILFSLFAFLALDCGVVKLVDRSQSVKSDSIDLNENSDNEMVHGGDPKIQTDIKRLLSISVIINFLSFGILPALSSLSTLPYGRKAYLIQSIATPFANASAVLIGLICSSTKSIYRLIVLLLIGLSGTCYIIAVSVMSPCSPLYRSQEGAVQIIIVWFAVTLFLCYSRLLIVNRIRIIDPSKMFWFGASVQLGGLLGAVPMYILTNHSGIFKGTSGCEDIIC
ncbi:hypothetical protein GJ496_004881 [Pomphorhynchus laevis]|nr:hypothetical protein GJ496_004881 [Pomphorhynchus laevis]